MNERKPGLGEKLLDGTIRFAEKSIKLARNLDPESKKVYEFLEVFHSTLKELRRSENLPKVLEIRVGAQIYTSVRKLEGQQLAKIMEPNAQNNVLEVFIPEDIAEGQIGMFMYKYTFSPISDSFKKSLLKLPEYQKYVYDEKDDGFPLFLFSPLFAAFAQHHPEFIKPPLWKPEFDWTVNLAFKKRDKMWLYPVFDGGEDLYVRKETPINGKFVIYRYSPFYPLRPNKPENESVLRVAAKFLQEFGAFYVFQEGQADRKKSRLKVGQQSISQTL